ncbi:MAG: hypothetical protein GX046_07860 [Tissierellia bacterium]|nr:hypothetical protein [Tissierellia bacterium]
MRHNDKKKNLAIGVGVGMAVSAGIGTLLYKKYTCLKDNSDFLFIADNKTVDFSDEVFEDVSVVALASNILIDLSGAQADENPMTLYLKGMGSNVDIVVPDGWNVKPQGTAKRSQLDNATEFDYDDIKAPLLFIDYDLKGTSFNVFYAFNQEDDEYVELVFEEGLDLEDEELAEEILQAVEEQLEEKLEEIEE